MDETYYVFDHIKTFTPIDLVGKTLLVDIAKDPDGTSKILYAKDLNTGVLYILAILD